MPGAPLMFFVFGVGLENVIVELAWQRVSSIAPSRGLGRKSEIGGERANERANEMK